MTEIPNGSTPAGQPTDPGDLAFTSSEIKDARLTHVIVSDNDMMAFFFTGPSGSHLRVKFPSGACINATNRDEQNAVLSQEKLTGIIKSGNELGATVFAVTEVPEKVTADWFKQSGWYFDPADGKLTIPRPPKPPKKSGAKKSA